MTTIINDEASGTNFQLTDFQKLIQPVYEVLSQYQMNERMETCPCCSGSISKEINNLCIKNLRSLTVEDFGPYPGKAMTTWGDINDFKYFLPRLLDLEVYKNPYDFHFLSSKLELAEFAEWPSTEKAAIEYFFSKYFLYLASIKEDYCASKLAIEFRKLVPNFLNDAEIEKQAKIICYNATANQKISTYEPDFIQLINDAFGERAAIAWILEWPESEEALLKFATLINTLHFSAFLFTPETRIKFRKIMRLLENYWFNNLTNLTLEISGNISDAIHIISCIINEY